MLGLEARVTTPSLKLLSLLLFHRCPIHLFLFGNVSNRPSPASSVSPTSYPFSLLSLSPSGQFLPPCSSRHGHRQPGAILLPPQAQGRPCDVGQTEGRQLGSRGEPTLFVWGHLGCNYTRLHALPFVTQSISQLIAKLHFSPSLLASSVPAPPLLPLPWESWVLSSPCWY